MFLQVASAAKRSEQLQLAASQIARLDAIFPIHKYLIFFFLTKTMMITSPGLQSKKLLPAMPNQQQNGSYHALKMKWVVCCVLAIFTALQIFMAKTQVSETQFPRQERFQETIPGVGSSVVDWTGSNEYTQRSRSTSPGSSNWTQYFHGDLFDNYRESINNKIMKRRRKRSIEHQNSNTFLRWWSTCKHPYYRGEFGMEMQAMFRGPISRATMAASNSIRQVSWAATTCTGSVTAIKSCLRSASSNPSGVGETPFPM